MIISVHSYFVVFGFGAVLVYSSPPIYLYKSSIVFTLACAPNAEMRNSFSSVGFLGYVISILLLVLLALRELVARHTQCSSPDIYF